MKQRGVIRAVESTRRISSDGRLQGRHEGHRRGGIVSALVMQWRPPKGRGLEGGAAALKSEESDTAGRETARSGRITKEAKKDEAAATETTEGGTRK